MGDLTEVTDQLSELETMEAELEKSKSKLGKKDPAAKLDSLQSVVIGYQKDAISALLRILKERDSIGDYWESLTNEVINLRGVVDEANKALGSIKDKRVKELESQLEASKKAIVSLSEDVSTLRLRIKVLIGQ